MQRIVKAAVFEDHAQIQQVKQRNFRLNLLAQRTHACQAIHFQGPISQAHSSIDNNSERCPNDIIARAGLLALKIIVDRDDFTSGTMASHTATKDINKTLVWLSVRTRES